MGKLVANAVTLLSCPTPNPSPMLDDLARHFATRTRAVAVVPYDPALEAGLVDRVPGAGPGHQTRLVAGGRRHRGRLRPVKVDKRA